MFSNNHDAHETPHGNHSTHTETINADKVDKFGEDENLFGQYPPAERDEIIKKYLESQIPNAKSYFCKYFKRGLCHFSAKECKFAHEAEDFVFNEKIHLDLSILKTVTKEKNKKASKGEEKKKESNDEEEEKEPEIIADSKTQSLIKRPEQKSIKLEKEYIKLYEYQLLQKGQGKIEKVYTLEEIGQIGPVKAAIRRSMLREVGLGFYDLLFRELKTNALKTTLVDAFFANIGWNNLLPVVTDNQYAFEVNHQSGSYIVKIPKQDELFGIIEDNIISLITSLKLFDNLPISPSLLKNHYYKEITAKKPFEPTLLTLQKNTGLTLDEFLQRLQQSEKFKVKLAVALGQDLAALKDIILFESSSNEIKQFYGKINRLLKEYMEESTAGIAKYSSFEKKIFLECQHEIKRYNNNSAYIRKLIKSAAFRNKIFILQLLSDTYLFSLTKLKNISSQELKEVSQLIQHNCKESNPLMGPEFKFPPFKQYVPKEGDQLIPKDPYPKELLDKEIDLSKVVLVDNLEKLEHAKSLLPDSKVVGVDLEGNLEKDGHVELVQCSYGGKIFVFDIYSLAKAAQDLQNEKAQTTYQRTLRFLQEMMESPAICKVFHDGRKDSVGLHSCVQSCLINTFDVSANHSLLLQLEVYNKYQKALALDELKSSVSLQEIKNNEQLSDDKCEEILKHLEIAARPPGLNDVLESYKASHGINGLKMIMKERFWTLSRGYFFQRPIDVEYLIYAAKDVEDLEEVRSKIMKKLEGVLKNICSGLPNEIFMLLLSYISYLHTHEGCVELSKLE